MPDTRILAAWQSQLSAAFSSMENRLEIISAKIDGVRSDFGTHGERLAKLEEKATAAHRRIDEANEELGGPGKGGWTAIIVAFLTAVASVVVAIFSKGHK